MGLNNIQSKTDATKSFIVYLIGVLLMYSAFYGIGNLQSSVNVEGGLGTTALAVYSSTVVFCSIFILPVMKHLITPKHGMVISGVCELIYTLLNFEPSFATLIPANLINGFGRSLFWVFAGLFSIFYAKEFAGFSGKDSLHYFSLVNGCVFSAILSGQIIGNMIPFTVFEIALLNDHPTLNTTSSSTITSNITTSTLESMRFSVSDICGAKDCQDPSVTGKNVSNYKPPSQTSYYIVMGVFSGLMVLAILLHSFFAPSGEDNVSDKTTKEKVKPYINNAFVEEGEREDENNNNNKDIMDPNNNAVKDDKKETFDIIDLKESDNEIDSVETSVASNKFEGKKNIATLWFTEVRDILKFFFTFHQLLMFPFSFYAGFQLAFIISEITRAYIACVYGVAEIGIAMTICGVGALISSLLLGKATGKFGRNPIIGIVFVFNSALYLFYLLWIPDENSSLIIIYGLLFLCGVSDSATQVLSSEVVVRHFSDETEKVYTTWTVGTSIGIALQFAWSTSVCVNHKVYALLGTLGLSLVTYVIAELKYMRKQEESQVDEIEKPENITKI